MIYCDFGEPKTNIHTMWGAMLLPRYAAFTGSNMIPSQALFKARLAICEADGKVYWYKNGENSKLGEDLTNEELKQFLFQKLSSEVIR